MTKHDTTAAFDGIPAVPQPGEVIAGKYRIEAVLGTGGMGVVLCATHLTLGQQVAIKVLTVPENDARKDEARERFIREGRATAALVSDHVVRVYDVGTLDDGAPFMVMELLRGEDLARTLHSGPLSIELACECVRQAAEAIACAHEHGIVHRDLKPSNLFLTQRSDGSALIKVLDFGISKSTSVDQQRVTGLTLERSVLGTPFYMSPEQVRDAKNVDARTDIWSLGLILHELLSGSPAFEGTTLPGVCAAIAADPPAALRLKRPEVPVEVEALVLKCLEKSPARRFQTARELAVLLGPWAGRTESGPAGLLHDRTLRSSPLGPELALLRDGTTVASPGDGSTLASAVFITSESRPVAESGRLLGSASDGPHPPPLGASASSPKRRQRQIKLTVAACLVLSGALLLWSFRGAPQRPVPYAAPSATPIAPAASPIGAAHFSLQIESTPPGAEVYEGETLLGQTPLRVDINHASVTAAPRTFVVRRSGYLPYTVVQGVSASDRTVLAQLVAPESPEPPSPPKGTHGAAPSTAKHPSEPKPQSSTQTPGADIFMHR